MKSILILLLSARASRVSVLSVTFFGELSIFDILEALISRARGKLCLISQRGNLNAYLKSRDFLFNQFSNLSVLHLSFNVAIQAIHVFRPSHDL